MTQQEKDDPNASCEQVKPLAGVFIEGYRQGSSHGQNND